MTPLLLNQLTQAAHPPQPHVSPVPSLQDLAAMGGLLIPVIVAVGFFFTMKAKLEELDNSIKTQGEMTLLKIENRFISLSQKISSFHEHLLNHEMQIRELKAELEQQRTIKTEIVRQLAAFGMDVCVPFEKLNKHKST